MNRKTIAAVGAAGLAVLAAFALSSCGNKGASSNGAQVAQSGEDMSMGKSDAPVKVIEYASPTCPHCAKYEKDDFPAFKAKYIDTGKVFYVFREFPIHPTLDGPAFVLARCAPKDKYFDVIQGVMEGQKDYYNPAITSAPNADQLITDAYRTTLLKVGHDVAGLDEKAAIACMSNGDALSQLDTRSKAQTAADNVNETPTFFVNGVRVEQPGGVEMSNALVFPAVDQALAKKKG